MKNISGISTSFCQSKVLIKIKNDYINKILNHMNYICFKIINKINNNFFKEDVLIFSIKVIIFRISLIMVIQKFN